MDWFMSPTIVMFLWGARYLRRSSWILFVSWNSSTTMYSNSLEISGFCFRRVRASLFRSE